MLIGKYISKIGVPIILLLTLYLINPYGLNVYTGYLITALLVLKKKFIFDNLDLAFTILLLFSFTYAAFFSFEPKAGSQYIIIYAIIPSTFYMLGKYFVEKLEFKSYYIFIALLLIGTLFSLTALVSVVSAIREYGFSVVERNLPNFWNGQIIPATIMGSFFIFNMCIPALLVVRMKNLSWLSVILLLLLYFTSVLCILRIGSRTQLGISLVTLLTSLIYVIPRQSFRRNILTFALFGMLILYTMINVNFDFNQDFLSAFAGRMENNGAGDLASGGGRTERWGKSLNNLFEKPFGWEESEFGHAHNLWFDTLRIGGFIPFFLLILFSVNSILGVKKAVTKLKNAYALNNQFILYTIAFLLIFMVEPILEGMFSLFAIFCFFIGVVKKYYTA